MKRIFVIATAFALIVGGVIIGITTKNTTALGLHDVEDTGGIENADISFAGSVDSVLGASDVPDVAEVAKAYTEAMNAEDYAAVLSLHTQLRFCGLSPEPWQAVEGVDYTFEEAEELGLLGKKFDVPDEKYYELFEMQRNLVTQKFGEDAWKNVEASYRKVEHSYYSKPGYMLVSTGELISEEEYSEINEKYWTEISSAAGYTYEELFLYGEGEAAAEENGKKAQIFSEHLANAPAVLTSVGEFDMYVASFSFNGKSEATVDEVTNGGFNILIDNSEGGWKVFYGLSWDHSEPCLGDI